MRDFHDDGRLLELVKGRRRIQNPLQRVHSRRRHHLHISHLRGGKGPREHGDLRERAHQYRARPNRHSGCFRGAAEIITKAGCAEKLLAFVGRLRGGACRLMRVREPIANFHLGAGKLHTERSKEPERLHGAVVRAKISHLVVTERTTRFRRGEIVSFLIFSFPIWIPPRIAIPRERGRRMKSPQRGKLVSRAVVQVSRRSLPPSSLFLRRSSSCCAPSRTTLQSQPSTAELPAAGPGHGPP